MFWWHSWHNNPYKLQSCVRFMDLIKESFTRVKEDIQILSGQINLLNSEIQEIKRTLSSLDRQTNRQTIRQISQTQPQITQTNDISSQNKLPLEALKSPNTQSSIGNEGVQTDRQTNRQTDRQTEKDPLKKIQEVSRLLESLDEVKIELRNQFKRLTNQEMAVFSSIYALEEQGFIVDYSLLADKLSLSESAIRDYVIKIIQKGVPIHKNKENNKKIILSIAPEIKKIANLSTIQDLRKI